MPDQNIEVLKQETYLKTIENAVGTRMFNSVIVRFKDSGEIKDVLGDGEYSCASFVSSLLFLFGRINKTHTTVQTVREKILADQRWRQVTDGGIVSGDVLFWEKLKFPDGSENEHVGFALNSEEAVSTGAKQKCVIKHPVSSDRGITAVFRYVGE